mgnify:FL=1
MNEIVPEFNDSLVIDSSDIVGDYLELGIDSILENDSLKGIPIIKTFISVGKITKSIRERNLIKNLAIFINELNSGKINKEKLSRHREELRKNPKKAEKELGRILIILEQTIDNIKSSILGKLYKSYINQEIDWDIFIEFSEITNRLFMFDINILKVMWSQAYNTYIEQKDDNFRIERMYSLGIIGNIFPSMNETKHLHGRVLNGLGKKYCDIIFR